MLAWCEGCAVTPSLIIDVAFYLSLVCIFVAAFHHFCDFLHFVHTRIHVHYLLFFKLACFCFRLVSYCFRLSTFRTVLASIQLHSHVIANPYQTFVPFHFLGRSPRTVSLTIRHFAHA